MNQTQAPAEWLSTSCFLNSLLREWQDWHVCELPKTLGALYKSQNAIRIDLTAHLEFAIIWVPLLRFSKVGRHRYALPLLLEDKAGHAEPLGLLQLAEILIAEESIIGRTQQSQRAIFLQRLRDSLEMMGESLEYRRDDIARSFTQELSFREAEQLLLVGHSCHPTPKSRDEFTAADKLLYSPEMAGHFALSWLAVHPGLFVDRRSEHFDVDWIQKLIAGDKGLENQLMAETPTDFRLLPMHPWQALRLREHPALLKPIADGRIRFLSSKGNLWRPTSSLRSLYRQEAPFMLKFSLSLKLTNSIRHLLVPEVERGVQVFDVLQSDHGRQLLTQQPALHIICEPAYAALKDESGRILHESIVVCRENPFQKPSDPQAFVLATLTQEDALGRGNLLLQHIKAYAQDERIGLAEASRQWFQKFCQVALEPLIVAQSDFGILLGAHQQNLLISLTRHLPDRLYFRDCQGTGYAEWAYERMRHQVRSFDRENGNIVAHDMAIYLFTYYLVINSAFNVIAAIADGEVISEEELLAELRQLVQRLIDRKPYDDELLQDLLQEEFLMHKGNFQCSVQSINENTSKNPLAIYTPIRNPLL